MFHITSIAVLTAFTAVASADFLIANTTKCMGAFPMNSCYQGAQVLAGVDFNKDYTCDNLYDAENNRHLINGTAGETGSMNFYSDPICNSGRLFFVKEPDAYMVFDENEQHVGDCTPPARDQDVSRRHCSLWVGADFFESTYLCVSSICS